MVITHNTVRRLVDIWALIVRGNSALRYCHACQDPLKLLAGQEAVDHPSSMVARTIKHWRELILTGLAIHTVDNWYDPPQTTCDPY